MGGPGSGRRKGNGMPKTLRPIMQTNLATGKTKIVKPKKMAFKDAPIMTYRPPKRYW